MPNNFKTTSNNLSLDVYSIDTTASDDVELIDVIESHDSNFKKIDDFAGDIIEHTDLFITDEKGVHGIRWDTSNQSLKVYNEGTTNWDNIETGGGESILVLTKSEFDDNENPVGSGLYPTLIGQSIVVKPNIPKWEIQNSASDNNWNSVCYGNGLFVALANVDTDNSIMTSYDGVNWVLRNGITDHDWCSICYGNGLFVAVANSGSFDNRVMTSFDGVNWTARTTPAGNGWTSVCYGNGLFVAVAQTGTGDRVMTSPNGIDWTIRTSAAENTWKSVCYGGGLFVAVARTGSGNCAMTSPNGIDWTICSTGGVNMWESVCYGNGLFVAVASTGSGNRVMTSPNGIDWTIGTSAADSQWRSVCYGNGLFVAVALMGSGNRVMTSLNGIDWVIDTSAADNFWTSVCYGNGLFVAVAAPGSGNQVMIFNTNPTIATNTYKILSDGTKQPFYYDKPKSYNYTHTFNNTSDWTYNSTDNIYSIFIPSWEHNVGNSISAGLWIQNINGYIQSNTFPSVRLWSAVDLTGNLTLYSEQKFAGKLIISGNGNDMNINIQLSNVDLIPGVSSLADGALYFVYE